MPSRRRLLASSGFAFAGLFGSYAAVTDGADRSDPSTLDWPMARYDAAGTSHNPAASGPKANPRLAWDGTLEDTGGFVIAPPVVVDDTVVAGHDDLVAFDAGTGDVRFSYGVSGSSPAYASTSIYRTGTLAVNSPSGTVGLNAGGGLDLFGLRVGERRWGGPGSEPDSPVPGTPNLPPPPIAVGETVFTAVPDAGAIVALEADNGRERWRRTITDETETAATLRRPAASDGTVFVSGWPSQVRAFDAETGAEAWRAELDEQMVLAPTATADGVVVPTRRGVVLYERNGDERWRRDVDGNATRGAAAVADGRAFVADGTESLRALDLETGATEWTVPFTADASPVVADGVVYVTDGYDLTALDAATGDRLFIRETEWYFSPPAIGDGVLYIVDGDRLLALEEAA